MSQLAKMSYKVGRVSNSKCVGDSSLKGAGLGSEISDRFSLSWLSPLRRNQAFESASRCTSSQDLESL